MARRVAALVLAAGISRRMGRPKQLLPLGGKPVLVHCLDTLRGAGIRDIVVVGGMRGPDLSSFLSEPSATLVVNPDPDSDMAGSVLAGLRAIDDRCTGVLVCLSDHPLVTAETSRSLISLHEREPHRIIIPSYGGKRGHPTLFPRAAISGLSPGKTLLDIVRANEAQIRTVAVADEGVILNMNTPADYRHVAEKFALHREETAQGNAAGPS